MGRVTGGWVKVKASTWRMFSATVIGEGDCSGSILSWFSGDDGGGIGSGEI